MKTLRVAFLLIPVAMLLAAAWAWAEEPAAQPAPAVEKASVSVSISPNEVRNYKVAVHMTGRMPGEDSAKPVDVDADYSMKLEHKYGRRENDGLLPLEISATQAEATVAGEKLALPLTDFPKLTLLIDRSWKVANLFGLAGTRYAGQVPGLNYSNLVMLFFVPDGATPHAIGESWTSKIKLPGISDECSVTTTLKSLGEKDGTKTVTVAQEYVWPQQTLANGNLVNSRATVQSVLALDTGKLLTSHAECSMNFATSASAKQDTSQYHANNKIDISLEK